LLCAASEQGPEHVTQLDREIDAKGFELRMCEHPGYGRYVSLSRQLERCLANRIKG
jgi:hypothetical protein